RADLVPSTTPDGYKIPSPLSLGGGALATAFDRFTTDDKKEFLHAYYAGVSFMDAQVGRVLDALADAGSADDTVVVFLGDHGYELGVRNWWNKNTLFERSCRTPLVVRVPGAKGNGRASAALVEFIDVYPTIAEACGLKAPPLEGRSFRALLDDPTLNHKDAALTVVKRGKITGRSLRTERFRYTEWDGAAQAAELYDHAADPGEWTNLAADEKHRSTRADLSDWIKRIEAAKAN
ncbi:MAG: sulfatase-like hydrolase/transferase, partial [Planctomycetia bacterium]